MEDLRDYEPEECPLKHHSKLSAKNLKKHTQKHD